MKNILKKLFRSTIDVFVGEDQMSPEQSFRFLVRRLAGDYGRGSGPTTFVVTPTEAAGEVGGETLMLTSLLQEEIGARVLLIDADFAAEESLSDRFGYGGEPGLAQMLAGEHTSARFVLRETKREKVAILPRGTDPDQVDRASLKERLTSVLSSVSADFDFVVIAQCAVTVDTRGLEMVEQSDCVLLFAREGTSRLERIEDQEAALMQNGEVDVRIVLLLPEPMFASHEDESD
ncbi:MAG: hypothetical protein AAFY47_08095 [Pseudomonadota bacterium]